MFNFNPGALVNALHEGDPEKLKALIATGADIHFRDASRYDALIHAVHGRDVFGDERLLDFLRLLIDRGVELSGITTYCESGLRVLSRLGRFDAVKLLLQAGADEAQLAWTPLIKAVALGSLADVQAQLDHGADLEGRDWWSRTAWLVALQVGDVAKAALLRERGADTAAVGRCGQPPLFYPIHCRRTETLRWLLELGFDVEQTDEFGSTALHLAAEQDYEEGAVMLLQAGAQIDRVHNGGTALEWARSRAMIFRLLEAGADPKYLSNEGRRIMVGLPPEPDEELLADVTAAEFARGRNRRFGQSNPERVEEPFWLGMIRAGITGWGATERFKGPSSFDAGAVWCAQRFGQSITALPDGRLVLIAGEHEDSYDPDFCIYNDVLVHNPDGKIEIYAYPEDVFPPTDFHTATLIGDAIYLIGSLGYSEKRKYGSTPVYRLDTRTWKIQSIETGGENPGWIYQHRAVCVSQNQIRVTGGKVMTMKDNNVRERENEASFVLDIEKRLWRTATE